MSQTVTGMKQQKHDGNVASVDMKLEVDVIPVSDVERSKELLGEDPSAAEMRGGGLEPGERFFG